MRRFPFILFTSITLSLLIAGCDTPPVPTLIPTNPPATPTVTPTSVPTREARIVQLPTSIPLPDDTSTPSPSPAPSKTAPPLDPPTLVAAAAVVEVTSTPEPFTIPLSTPIPYNRAQVTDTLTYLNIREMPSIGSRAIGQLDPLENLTVAGRSSDSRWLLVLSPGGNFGWVLAQHVNYEFALRDLPVMGMNAVFDGPPGLLPARDIIAEADDPALLATAELPPEVITNITPTAREIYLLGLQRGNRRHVFSKVGDSLTVATYFLYPFSWGEYNLRGYGHLAPALQHFSRMTARDADSFGNNSLAADNQWTSYDVLDPINAHLGLCRPGETPIACEYRVTQPSLSLILIGTNDMGSIPVDEFRENIYQIVEISVFSGVVPVVSTLPNRWGINADVNAYNQAIIDVAEEFGTPVWHYGETMRTLPQDGLSPDGTHPSFPAGDYSEAADLTAANLEYGYTLRNLMALQVLQRMLEDVMYIEAS